MPRWPYLIRKARCRDNSFLFGKLSREFWRNKRTPTRELAHAEKKKEKLQMDKYGKRTATVLSVPGWEASTLDRRTLSRKKLISEIGLE